MSDYPPGRHLAHHFCKEQYWQRHKDLCRILELPNDETEKKSSDAN